MEKSKFAFLLSLQNFNKMLSQPIFKNEHNENRFIEFVQLQSKRYCLVDEKNVVYTQCCKGCAWKFRYRWKENQCQNIDLYKRILEVENKKDADIN